MGGTTTQIVNGVGKSIYASGSVTVSVAAAIVSGTATIVMDGTGTLSTTSTSQLRNNLTINTAGTITLGANIVYNTGAFTYTSGTINAGTSIFTIGAAATTFTFNASGFVFNDLSNTGSTTQQFTGTNGFTVAILRATAATAVCDMRFKEGNTYTINSYRLNGINAFRITVRSITAGQVAYINFSGANTREVSYTNFTDIDCTGGATIFTYYGTISNSNNVVSLTQPVSAFSFLN